MLKTSLKLRCSHGLDLSTWVVWKVIFYGMCFFLETSIVLRISFTRPLSTGKFFGSEAGFRISVNYSFTPKVESGCKSDDNVEILILYKILLDKGFTANASDQAWRFF